MTCRVVSECENCGESKTNWKVRIRPKLSNFCVFGCAEMVERKEIVYERGPTAVVNVATVGSC